MNGNGPRLPVDRRWLGSGLDGRHHQGDRGLARLRRVVAHTWSALAGPIMLNQGRFSGHGRYRACAIADQLQEPGVKLALALYDPNDPMGKMFFNILATFAEFEADLIRLRTREGMAIARARGELRGKQPKLSDRQQPEL